MKKLSTLLLASTLVLSCTSKKEETLEQKAKRIHQNVITLDTHNDINVNNFTDSINYTQRLETQVNIPKMNEGGLDVTWLIVYTGQKELNEAGYESAKENAMAKFHAIHQLCAEYGPDEIELALTSEDVRNIHAKGKKVAMIGVENAYPIGTDLSNIALYQKYGARYVSLSHNGHSQFCDSNTGEANNDWMYNGLSDLGKEAVKELNRVGIMVDVSHVSKESMMQISDLSKAPIIASHSSARALCDHSRNLDDEQLQRIKEVDGVVQTVAFSSYLNTEKHQKYNAYLDEKIGAILASKNIERLSRQQAMALDSEKRDAYYQEYLSARKEAVAQSQNEPDVPQAVSVVDLVDHVDYMVNLIGIDHVGISSDFDGGGGIMGWSDASETFNVTLELVKRGYSQAEISKLWSGNLLRVLDAVQEVAMNIQSEE